MNPIKVDSLKKGLWLFSYDFSSDENYCFRVNSTRKSYKLRKIPYLVASKYLQYKSRENLFSLKNSSHKRFYKYLTSNLVLICKNNPAKKET
jgi:hypothetical protein